MSKTKAVYMRISENEMKMFNRQASENKMNRSRYFVYLLEREEKAYKLKQSENAPDSIVVYKDSELNRVIWHLGHWGNNLNQVSKALNRLSQGQYFSEAKTIAILEKAGHSLEELLKSVIKIKEAVYAMKEERHIVIDDR